MIISASRRTDIPAFYFDWFLNRIREGYVLVRNPMNPRQVSRIRLDPGVVDGIVFWSKNPAPMLGKLSQLSSYAFYLQFTLNAYGKEIEPFLPPLKDRISTFQRLGQELGKKRMVWRYDPILLSPDYTWEFHIRQFERLARELSPYTEKCVISFIDVYNHRKKKMEARGIRECTADQMRELGEKIGETGQKYGLTVETCAEAVSLEEFGIGRGQCVDKRLLEDLLGCALQVEKDDNQRKECGCISSIDIGTYHTCTNGCLYCYANRSLEEAVQKQKNWDPMSPILCGRIEEGDRITERKMKSLIRGQMTFADLF
jgi:DNA repair photolyase